MSRENVYLLLKSIESYLSEHLDKWVKATEEYMEILQNYDLVGQADLSGLDDSKLVNLHSDLIALRLKYKLDIATKLRDQIKKQGVSNGVRHILETLTTREREVLTLIAKGMKNAEIAEELFISVRTVESHRRNLLGKIGAKNTAGLVLFAVNSGLTK